MLDRNMLLGNTVLAVHFHQSRCRLIGEPMQEMNLNEIAVVAGGAQMDGKTAAVPVKINTAQMDG